MVQDDRPVGLDGVQVKFDDERVVSDAGVMLVATLAERLGIEALAERLVRLRRDRPGAANAGRKVMALVYAMVLGADSIDDCEVLRAGRTRRLLGGWVPAPSTLGTFLRAFTFGHVRQLDALLGQALERAWRAGAGPGDGRLVIDVDSFVGEVCGRLKQGAGLRLHPAARLPPDPRHPRGHPRGAAHPSAQGVGEHPEGDAALHRRADRSRDPRRRDRRQAAAGRLRVLEHQGLQAAGEAGLAVLDRGADAKGDPRGRRSDRRGRLADDRRLPQAGRGADRRDHLRRAGD